MKKREIVVIQKFYRNSLWEFGTKCDGERIRGGLILFSRLILREVRFTVTFLFACNIHFQEKNLAMGDSI